MKRKFYTEAAYVIGLIILAVGTALMEKADLGMSMVVAPAYLLHLRLSQVFPWFSFGVAEYTLQFFLLVLMVLLLRQFRVGYLFSFVTAVIYGVLLDGAMLLTAPLPVTLILRGVYYVSGLLLGSVAIAFLLHTYIAPEVYELIVKEWAAKYGTPVSKVKTTYDCISCGVSILLSFCFFGLGNFKGVKWGTILCALVNGWLIGRISAALEGKFEFTDAFRK